MESEGVINVKRVKKRVNGELVDTPTHILTFNRPKLPNKVKAAFYSLEVRTYIPNPMRCYNCQKFGHVTNSCKEAKICACGKRAHMGQVCQDPIKCVNCGGAHSAKSKECPRMIEEVNIQHVKVLENLSYAEARRKVCGPKKTMTFAQITSNASNVPTVLQTLIPNITKVIENQIQAAFSKLANQQSTQSNSTAQTSTSMNPPLSGTTSGRMIGKSSSFSDASQIREKRKRKENTNYAADDSFESDTSMVSSQLSDTSRREKKKRGWPKGKARKPKENQPSNKTPQRPIPSDGDQNSNEIPQPSTPTDGDFY